MPNVIKYSTTAQTLALKKDSIYFGVEDVGKGPSSTTGYYNGVNPATGGYVVYLYNATAPGNIAYHSAANDSALIQYTNDLSGQSFTTVNQCLVWYRGQTDKVCVNRNYEKVITTGLVLDLDAGFTPSYPISGTTWYDVSTSGYHSSLINNTTYSNGYMSFDGSDDYVSAPLSANTLLCSNEITIMGWVYVTSFPNTSQAILAKKTSASSNGDSSFTLRKFSNGSTEFQMTWNNSLLSYFDSSTPSINTWFHMAIVVKNGSPGFQMFLNGNNNNGASTSYVSPSWSDVNTYNWQFGLFETATGRVANVLFYNRALTQTEVQQNYNAQKGRFGL